MTPPWREIYRMDAQRRLSFDEALRGHDASLAAYAECGYEPIEVPRAPVPVRAEFILEQVRKNAA